MQLHSPVVGIVDGTKDNWNALSMSSLQGSCHSIYKADKTEVKEKTGVEGTATIPGAKLSKPVKLEMKESIHNIVGQPRNMFSFIFNIKFQTT